MPVTAPEFLCIGETMTLVFPDPSASLETAESFRIHIGGAESNMAMYLADMGHTAGWLSRVGNDPFGRRMTFELQRHGVDVSQVMVDGDSPTAVYFKDPTPQGTKVHYYRKNSAASRMDVEDIDKAEFAGVKVVHLSGITPGLSASCARMIERAMRKAHEVGAVVSFDVNYRPGVWSTDIAAPVLADLARRADVVLVGRDEAETLWDAATPEDIATYLSCHGTLVVKDSDIGATEFSSSGSVFVPALDVEVVEPVGAGDAFAAGYLSSWIRGQDAESRLKRGHHLAARALGSLSDFNPESVDEINPA